MTMTSGAVFFDTHDVEKHGGDVEAEDGSNKSSNSIKNEDEQLTDDTEDALMKQVVMATQRKTELLNSMKKLNEQDNEESQNDGETSDVDIEFNLKPSTLRRLSKSSQILHLENIAKMKKRRSQTDFDMPMESSPVESDNETEGDITSHEQKQERKISNVSEMTEVFTKRSKNNVREYARRRTLDNYPSKEEGFSKSVLSDDEIEGEDITLNENERSFHSMEVDVSDLVQRHHKMIHDKTTEGDTLRSALQRHKSFPSADRKHHIGSADLVGVNEAVGEKNITSQNVTVVKSIVGSFENKKDDKTILKVLQRKESKRPSSLNIENTSSLTSTSPAENVSSEWVMGRRRASTDVDLRSKNGSSGDL